MEILIFILYLTSFILNSVFLVYFLIYRSNVKTTETEVNLNLSNPLKLTLDIVLTISVVSLILITFLMALHYILPSLLF